MGIPVVISTNGYGLPVRPVDSGAPLMIVATNGFGIPIVISDLGLPFVVQGLEPPPEPFPDGSRLLMEDGSSMLLLEDGTSAILLEGNM